MGEMMDKRKTSIFRVVFLETVANTVIATESAKRVGIRIFGVNSTTTFIIPGNPMTAINQGLNVGVNGFMSLSWYRDKDGDCVTKQWNAYDNTPGAILIIEEIFFVDELQ